MTKKFLTIALMSSALLGCGKNDTELANEKYVKASAKVSQAAEKFDAAQYREALELCKSAQLDIAEILKDYQDTPIALDIVKNASINVGPCPLANLRERVVPRLETLSSKDTLPISLPWAVALNLPDAERDTALANLAILALYSDRTNAALKAKGLKPAMDLSMDQRGAAVNAILSKMNSAELKNKVVSMRNAVVSEENKILAARKAAQQAERESDKKMLANEIKSTAKIVLGGEKIRTEKKPVSTEFMSKAKLWAKMIAYDLKASGYLLEASATTDLSKPEHSREFVDILLLAAKSARKINAPAPQAAALENISKAAANAGDCNTAIKLAAELKNPAQQAQAIGFAVAKLVEEGDIMHALAAVSKLPEGQIKNGFQYRIAVELARSGLAKEAREIANGFKDKALRDSCMIAIVCSLKNQNFDDIVSTLKTVDVKTLSPNTIKMLSNVIAPLEVSFSTQDGEIAARIAAIAGVLAKADKPLANAWIDQSMQIAIQAKNQKDFASALKPICENLIAAEEAQKAFEIVQKCAFRINDPSVFDTLCDIALTMSLAGAKEQAGKTFEIAAGLCKSFGEGGGERASMLSWYIALAGIDKPEAVKILKPFLPAF